jgi:imidazolonepropionase-like amidohydrolase
VGVLFTQISIIDGGGADPVPGEVLVEGERIARVATGNVAIPRDGHEVVQGDGATLMPGLTEAHGHLTFPNVKSLEEIGMMPPEENLLSGLRMAKLYLDMGFTSVNSAAAAKPRLDVVVRDAINSGDFPGPRMLAATPEMTVSGGLGDVDRWHQTMTTFAVTCDGPEEFRKMARIFCREGVDTLKINPSGDEFVPHARAQQTVMNEAEIAAVCEVARSRGKRVAVHARSAESVKLSVKHGAELIFHATYADDAAIEMLIAAKDRVFVVPTLGISYTTLNEAGPFGLSREVAVSLGIEAELSHGAGVMKALRQGGVRLLPGGDYGFAWNPHGTNARDLEHFVNLLGFTPMEAIVSATRLGGEIMMRGHELGQIREGYLADLLLVDGDPSKDIRLLQDRSKLLAVMKGGAFHRAPTGRAAQRRAA